MYKTSKERPNAAICTAYSVSDNVKSIAPCPNVCLSCWLVGAHDNFGKKCDTISIDKFTKIQNLVQKSTRHSRYESYFTQGRFILISVYPTDMFFIVLILCF